MSKNTETCPKQACPVAGCGNDVVGKFFGKFGVSRSTLVTLALVPFAWDGVLWFRDAISAIWNAVTAWNIGG
jgi:hypothetical protein